MVYAKNNSEVVHVSIKIEKLFPDFCDTETHQKATVSMFQLVGNTCCCIACLSDLGEGFNVGINHYSINGGSQQPLMLHHWLDPFWCSGDNLADMICLNWFQTICEQIIGDEILNASQQGHFQNFFLTHLFCRIHYSRGYSKSSHK